MRRILCAALSAVVVASTPAGGQTSPPSLPFPLPVPSPTPTPVAPPPASPAPPIAIPKFPLTGSGLVLSRPTRAGTFFDVVGRRAAVFGYEHRALEAWAYPLKLVDDFRLAFRVEGYPLEFDAASLAVSVEVRPEATVFTYAHAAFTVRQVLFAPVEEPGIVMLLDVDSVLPMTVLGSFRPRLRLMWPAGLMTGDLGWDEKAQVYTITEETKRFAAAVAVPDARDLSVMPYQEEPRDVPVRFAIDVPAARLRTHYVPIALAGSVEGRDAAVATAARLLGSARALYERNVAHYASLHERAVWIDTPDERLDTAFAWARIGVDKGLATNPLLGTGLVAGFRTSGESERPGFAWMFGRDALWTALAITSYGDFAATRTALAFLRRMQRADGKIAHEISQSAAIVPWFTEYKYPWESADATPLYVAVHADYWRTSGDRAFLAESWESIRSAWRFTAATDTDGNGLVENTKVGHGWTEGSPPYPPHEEIYLQGAWIEACRGMSELAEAMGDSALAEEARARAERTRAAVEATYWLPDRGFYAFATALRVPEKKYDAEPGPRRAERQRRIESLRGRTLIDEDTVLQAVPMWWRALDAERAQSAIDHLASGEMATDWGSRIISAKSELYDPLSYHYGSVWPLFTGWSSMAAYRYGRPHAGLQGVMATALLTFQGALGYVTELLSGDFNAPFGRSSHHQVWSEAMVVTPVARGLFGIEARDGGTTLAFAPQLPADWGHAAVFRVPAGESRYDLALRRGTGRMAISATRVSGPGIPRLFVAPALPLDARVTTVAVDGRAVRFDVRRLGDVQQVQVMVDGPRETTAVEIAYEPGTDVFVSFPEPERGARSAGLRIVRSRAEGGALRLVLDGRAGRTYLVGVRTPREVGAVPGVRVSPAPGGASLEVEFAGDGDGYVRREITLPLR